MVLRIITVVLATLTLLCGSVVAAERETGTITGYVFDAATGLPLRNVQVTVEGGPQLTTDATGSFRFDLAPGRYTLRIVRNGANPELIESVAVAGSESTEVLVTLYGDGRSPTIDIEQPEVGLDDAATKDQPPGRIRGTVVSLETHRPIGQARVFVRGRDVEATSTDEGTFELKLPPGTYELSVLHVDHSTQAVPDVRVRSGDVTEIRVEMSPAAFLLDTLTVRAPRVEGGTASLLGERRDSAAVSDVIGAEQMSKSGDSNAASALKRVTGLTVVGGKYVYVRGLGERYSSTLLNGSTLPSPEPERRVIPLDVFPAALLEGVIIPKTYQVNLPGEFGGGTVQLRTRRITDEPVRKVALSTGGNSTSTFRRGLTYSGGSLDFLGINDGSRNLPQPIADATQDGPLREGDQFSQLGYTAEELERFGEMVPNDWGTRARQLPPDVGLSATLGDRFELNGRQAGYLAALTYSNGWDRTETERIYYLLGSGEQLTEAHHYHFDESDNDIRLGGILNLGFEPAPGHELGATTTLVRGTTNSARIYEGHNDDVATRIRVTRLRWVERMLLSQQLTGDHELPSAADSKLSWRYTFSLARRAEPDRRETRFDLEQSTGDYVLSDRPEGNQRLYSQLNDFNHDFAADWKVPVHVLDDREASVTFGPNVVLKDRSVATRRFKFLHKGPISNDYDVLTGSPNEIFTPEHIGPDGFQFEEITRQTDNYDARQRIYAGYVQGDAQLTASLRAVAGVRLEHSTQVVSTFELFNPANIPVDSRLSNTDLLPAASLSWSFLEKTMLRAGFSRTVSRPEFRELSPATFNDVTGGRQIFGNPELQRATITSVDVRSEWYPASDEILSVGAYYKQFDDPIEQVVVVSAQHSITYDNADAATNLGLELEARKGLGFVSEALQDFYVAANGAIIRSEVHLASDSGIQTSNQRPLQGQSPYVVNVQLGWEAVEHGHHVSLLYNRFGPRISEVGAQGAPDIIEQPVDTVDLVGGLNLGRWALSLKAKNLLDLAVEKRQGGLVTERYHRGRELSLGLKLAF